jgi:hypothetical protein
MKLTKGQREDLELAETHARAAATLTRSVLDALEPSPPWIDRVDEMPVNHAPDHPYLVKRGWQWWPIRGEGKCPAKVTGLTIHHTCSHSPKATARYCTNSRGKGGKGYPTIQYHWWVSAGDGCPVFLLADPEWALWSDNTGAYQTTFSIGVAGRWDKDKPSAEQIETTAGLAAYLQKARGILTPEVRGHHDRWSPTKCPGWHLAGWRDEFYEALEAVR